MRVPVTAILGVLIGPVAGQEKAPEHLLRLSFASEHPTWWRVRQDMTSELTHEEETKVYRVRLDMFWRTRVESSAGGRTTLVHTLVRLRAAGLDDGEDAYAYDSATDVEAPGRSSQFVLLVGAEITQTVDEKGRVFELGLSEVLREMDQKSAVAFMSVTPMIRPSDLELPELPVAVGGRWRGSNARELEPTDEFAFESEYELLAVENGKAIIEQRFAMTLAEDEKKGRGDAERADGQRARRTFTLDLSTGRVVAVRDHTTVAARPAGERSRLKFTLERTVSPTVEPGDLEPLAPPARRERKK